jgi:hypothetical protein
MAGGVARCDEFRGLFYPPGRGYSLPQKSDSQGKQSMKSMSTGLLLLLSGVPVSAHHSTTAYDHSKLIELTGTVKEFQWTNPHSWIQLIVVDAQRQSTEWSIETGAPNLNIRHGWKRNDLKFGDKVTLTLYPHRDGSPHGSLARVALPDGRVLDGAADFILKDMAKEPGAPKGPPPGAQGPPRP